MTCAFWNNKRGFTLVELLVVVSIIALLISILLPSLSAARRTTQAMICKNNMRQLNMACVMYQGDYDNYLPQPNQDSDITDVNLSGAAMWFNALDYYLKLLAKDYARFDDDERNYRKFKQDPVWETWDELTRQKNRTIKMNDYFGHGTSASTPSGGVKVRFYRNSEVPIASRTVLFVDGRAQDTPSVTTGNTDGNEFYARPVYVGLRHNDGANVSFIDGHAAHRVNAVRQSPTGYLGWFDDDDPDPANRPDVIFNFRP